MLPVLSLDRIDSKTLKHVILCQKLENVPIAKDTLEKLILQRCLHFKSDGFFCVCKNMLLVIIKIRVFLLSNKVVRTTALQ